LQEHKNAVFGILCKKLEKEGKIPFFDDALINLYRLLTMYFTNNPEFENHAFIGGEYKMPYSLKKGILLMGLWGAGKSYALEKVFWAYAKKFDGTEYNLMKTSDLIKDFQLKGLVGLDDYKRFGFTNDKYSGLYLDEIGAKPHIVKHYGTNYKPIEHFIDFRYTLFTDLKIKTHASTNLTLSEFKELYDPRIYSRMFEMFNIIHVNTSKDLRMNFEKI